MNKLREKIRNDLTELFITELSSSGKYDKEELDQLIEVECEPFINQMMELLFDNWYENMPIRGNNETKNNTQNN